ncbi:MltA domain-containing protein [Desulfobotulus sp. H1]|uniref:peptidoglycan lytic exotransglycosylase n=1 Tax=Desulfobotulus pelophilus TaxID=2823377 RepID=A0ABT3NBJ0_9BACT|nr:MltA domain-containing protein [Desulfobotulus pelophilus]MCW7754827.1 MltA domain-containing protein [Desulfobotulus pelophilus]
MNVPFFPGKKQKKTGNPATEKKRSRMGSAFFLTLFLVLLITLAACSGKTPPVPPKQESPPPLIRLAPEAYPVFGDDLQYEGLLSVLYKSLEFYRRLSPDRPVRFGEDVYPASHMITTTRELMAIVHSAPDPETLNRVIKDNFLVYRAAGTPPPGSESRPQGKVLFTGYYEPLLKGSLSPGKDFSVPLHGMPDDLREVDLSPFGQEYAGKRIRGRWTGRTFEPYPDRDAICHENALAGKAPVIAYLSCPIDKFFLQVQGSGIVYLEEGGFIRVHYRGQNGRAYRSIGTHLIQTGKVPREEMSMQRIRRYLEENPQEQRSIMAFNPSYVFFHTVSEGPIGALGFSLTPGRSLAVDRRIFPDGAPVFIKTQKPLVYADGSIAAWQNFSRFMAAQDTGGAIRGSGRADIFWGNDGYAEIAAGHLQHPGEMYFLVLKNPDPA